MSRSRKIFLYFALGIGLPSAMLGYFAFHGVQNDYALLQQQRRELETAMAVAVTHDVDARISHLEADFLDVIRGQASTQDVSPALRALADAALVEEVFLIRDGRIELPYGTPLFHHDGLPAHESSQAAETADENATARALEFQHHRYEEALEEYRAAFAATPARQVAGELLNAIARVQLKLGLSQAAAESYRELDRKYGGLRLGGGLPLGVIAQMELGSLLLSSGDVSAAVESRLQLYRRLLEREWSLTGSQFAFVAQRLRRSADVMIGAAAGGHRDRLDELTELEGRRTESTHRLQAFRSRAATVAAMPPSTRSVLDVDGRTFMVSRLDDEWGLLLDAEQLQTALLEPSLAHSVPTEIGWTVTDHRGAVVSTTGLAVSPTVVRTTFVDGFPPWSISLGHKNPRLVQQLLTSRRGTNLYILILIIVILAFGLILTVRVLNQELDLTRLKSDFVSTVSHEFRSPLTSIRQLAEMLESGRTPSEERRQRYYRILVEQSERLSLLVDNLLDVARIEEGGKSYQFASVAIGPLLEETVSAVEHRVRHDGFMIETELDRPLPAIYADADAIGQAVTNLLDNAIKYSGAARRVQVRATAGNGSVVISVQDSGVGIEPKELRRVFDRFYRGGDELTRGIHGSGLGLSLVKHIAEAHGGRIDVDSEPGQGSVFSLSLPLESPV